MVYLCHDTRTTYRKSEYPQHDPETAVKKQYEHCKRRRKEYMVGGEPVVCHMRKQRSCAALDKRQWVVVENPGKPAHNIGKRQGYHREQEQFAFGAPPSKEKIADKDCNLNPNKIFCRKDNQRIHIRSVPQKLTLFCNILLFLQCFVAHKMCE